ncbi:MAG: AIR synthase related protein [Bacteroidota bacterium]
MIAEQTTIAACIETLRKHPDISDKRTIAQTYKHLGNAVDSSLYFPDEHSKIVLGDDAAAISQSDGSHLVFAAEGIITHFLNKDPWFAGYSAVMVNISDICAMGGLPLAVTDTLYVSDAEEASEIWDGMLAAASAYGIPIAGGHTCYRSDHKALSVSILGKATAHILTSFNAKPGETLVLAIDMNGTYYKDYAFWNSSTTSSAKVLQENARLPYEIANKKLS